MVSHNIPVKNYYFSIKTIKLGLINGGIFILINIPIC